MAGVFLFLLILLVPSWQVLIHIASFRNAPAATRYIGIRDQDIASHISMARQVGEGRLLFLNPYDPRPQRPVLVDLSDWLVGAVSWSTGISLPCVMVGLSYVFAVASALVFWGILRRVLKSEEETYSALALFLLGTGFGWVRLILHIAKTGHFFHFALPEYPYAGARCITPDLGYPITFLSSSGRYTTMAGLLVLLVFVRFLLMAMNGSRLAVVVCAVVALVLPGIEPFIGIRPLFIVPAYLLLSLMMKRLKREEAVRLLLCVAPIVVVPVWSVLIAPRLDPVFAEAVRGESGLYFPSPPRGLLLGLGMMLPLGLLSISKRETHQFEGLLLFAAWFLVDFLMSQNPIWMADRFFYLLYIPLAVLGAVGLCRYLRRSLMWCLENRFALVVGVAALLTHFPEEARGMGIFALEILSLWCVLRGGWTGSVGYAFLAMLNPVEALESGALCAFLALFGSGDTRARLIKAMAVAVVAGAVSSLAGGTLEPVMGIAWAIAVVFSLTACIVPAKELGLLGIVSVVGLAFCEPRMRFTISILAPVSGSIIWFGWRMWTKVSQRLLTERLWRVGLLVSICLGAGSHIFQVVWASSHSFAGLGGYIYWRPETLRMLKELEPESVVLCSTERGTYLPCLFNLRPVSGLYIGDWDRAREQGVRKFFRDASEEWRKDFLKKWRVKYMIWGVAEQPHSRFRPHNSDYLELVRAKGLTRIYKVIYNGGPGYRSRKASPPSSCSVL